jgi:TonB family protein
MLLPRNDHGYLFLRCDLKYSSLQKEIPMKRWTAILTLLFAATILVCPQKSLSQDDEGKRKVTNRVLPDYPDMARRMSLRGVVKVDAVVGSNGVVKTVEIKGGHPVLAQAAVTAVRKWKWEPSAHDTREPVEVKFEPGQQ